ncbi:hypothetical protein B0H13DRAFT_1866585 [Mycena leptocephala]|nr:hypothetical protein B0H13DRAFT_1866585 [Mycena leptocephala]
MFVLWGRPRGVLARFRTFTQGHERWASSTLRVEFWAWFLSWLPGLLCPHATTRPDDEIASMRRAQAFPPDMIPDAGDRRRNGEEGDEPPRTRVVDDADRFGYGDGVHTDSRALRVASIAENCHPQIHGSAIPLAYLLQHLAAMRARVMLLGLEIGMQGCVSGVEDQFHLPRLPPRPRTFAPHIIHFVGPIRPGAQAVISLQILFPGTPIMTNRHANLPTHAGILGWVLSLFAFALVAFPGFRVLSPYSLLMPRFVLFCLLWSPAFAACYVLHRIPGFERYLSHGIPCPVIWSSSVAYPTTNRIEGG